MNGWSPSRRRRVTLRSDQPSIVGAFAEVILILLVLIAIRLLVMRLSGA